MNRQFSSVVTNIGNNVQDTTASFATKIKIFVNNRYREIWERCNWDETINKDYTVASVVGTAGYNLPGDFDEELNCINTTDGFTLQRYTYDRWLEEFGVKYSSGSISNGASGYYAITGDSSSAVPVLTLLPTPNAVKTYLLPYKRSFAPLLDVSGTCTTNTADKIIASASTFITSGVTAGMRVKNTTDGTYGYVLTVDSETQLTMDSDLCPDGNETFTISAEFVIDGIDWCVEMLATGDALTAKRRPTDGAFYLQQGETALRRRIGRQKSKSNQSYQMIPQDRVTKRYEVNWGNGNY